MLKVLFMGTPDFASESLAALYSDGCDVVGVFTKPDKPKGRGMELSFSPVKELALQHRTPVFQPEKLRNTEVLEQVKALAPDIIVVVAYGKILPDDLLAVPPLGAINVHGSLLPKYRGAAPIQWSVINGDDITGVTTMYLAHDMDTGDIIYTDETPIGEFETSGELFDRLKVMGAKLLVKTLHDIENGTAPRTPQNHDEATYVTMIDKSICPIDFNAAPRQIIKKIYGLQPWPVATMTLGEDTVKVFSAEYSSLTSDRTPGSIVSADDKGIAVACADGATVLITGLQAPGKKRMSAADFLRGHRLEIN